MQSAVIHLFERSMQNMCEQNLQAYINGITRYTNHFAAPSKADKKQDYLMSNGGAHLANVGFDEIMKYVTSKTASFVSVTK